LKETARGKRFSIAIGTPAATSFVNRSHGGTLASSMSMRRAPATASSSAIATQIARIQMHAGANRGARFAQAAAGTPSRAATHSSRNDGTSIEAPFALYDQYGSAALPHALTTNLRRGQRFWTLWHGHCCLC